MSIPDSEPVETDDTERDASNETSKRNHTGPDETADGDAEPLSPERDGFETDASVASSTVEPPGESGENTLPDGEPKREAADVTTDDSSGLLFDELDTEASSYMMFMLAASSIGLMVWVIADPSRADAFPVLEQAVNYGIMVLIGGTLLRIFGATFVSDALSAYRGRK